MAFINIVSSIRDIFILIFPLVIICGLVFIYLKRNSQKNVVNYVLPIMLSNLILIILLNNLVTKAIGLNFFKNLKSSSSLCLKNIPADTLSEPQKNQLLKQIKKIRKKSYNHSHPVKESEKVFSLLDNNNQELLLIKIYQDSKNPDKLGWLYWSSNELKEDIEITRFSSEELFKILKSIEESDK